MKLQFWALFIHAPIFIIMLTAGAKHYFSGNIEKAMMFILLSNLNLMLIVLAKLYE